MKLQKWFMIFSLLLAVGFALVLTTGTAMAQTCDPKDPKCEPPPPPKDGIPCTPGFWKNHTELWFDGVCCDGDNQPTCDGLLAALKPQTPGSTAAIRDAAAAYLDGCVGRLCN